MILLTAQMQSQSGEPSLLQNPQVVSILQTLVNNAGSQPGVAPSSAATAAPTTAEKEIDRIEKLEEMVPFAAVFGKGK